MLPIRPRGRELGLPALSGLLLTLSFPPFHLLVPPFVAFVPFLVFLGSLRSEPAASMSAVRGGLVLGVVYYGTLLYWLFTALVFYTWLAFLGYVLTVAILSMVAAGAGYATHRLRIAHRLPFWATFPLLWTAAEWLRGHLGDLAFPWLGLGHSLTSFPWLVGFADVTGARGVTLWIVAVNTLIAQWWLRGRGRAPRLAAALALVIAVPIGYSAMRWTTLETRPAADVVVVQPNIPEDLKLEREAAEDSSRAALAALTGAAFAAATDPLDLVVWPETALPNYIQSAPDWVTWTSRLARDHRVGLLYGVLDFRRYPGGGFDYYNAALYISPEGVPLEPYRKHYLVPVVERVPFVPIGWLRDLRRSSRRLKLPLVGDISGFLRWFGGFGRGRTEPVFRVADSSFGVLICYESIFPGLARDYRRQGAEFLVNITNDAWFGRERPWWSQTSALYQHPAHLVMRAIENRMGVARSANTGISLFVDPHGRFQQETALFEPAARRATVRTTDDLTVYTRLGDWIGWSCAGASALLLLASGVSRRLSPGSRG